MSVSLPNGAIIKIGTAYGSDLTISAISNANPGVVTSAAHGLSNGDLVVVTSGWSKLNGKVVRVSGAATNSFSLEGIDTSSTSLYPAGSGTGSCKKVTTLTQISQILNSNTNGGEQQFLEYQFLEADAQTRIPTYKSAAGVTLTVADDPTLAGYVGAATANDDRSPRAIEVRLPNSSKIYYYGYVTLNPSPSLTVNELMAVQMTISFVNPDPVRYTS